VPALATAARASAAGAPADTLGALAVLAWLDHDPAAVRAGGDRIRAAVGATARAFGETPAGAVGEDGDGVPGAAASSTGAAPTEAAATTAAGAEAPAEEADAEVLPARTEAPTALGGVLFLLHLVDALGLPAALAADGPLAARPLRWSLHALALALAGAAPDDPAALAFAGLPPDAPAPDRDAPPATAAERAALDAAAARVTAALGERLGRPDAETALARVCARRGAIVADPGWLELHLPLDDVDLDIRRAGLDLDPGFLPWIGAVVRFVYA